MSLKRYTAVPGSVILFCLATALLSGQQADNGNGTFTNPVIWSDFPDNDVIRVGDTYYMVTTTMHVFPGVTILKSKDLVNWEYSANALPRLDIHPFYSLDGGSRYSHGQWATSIRYHNGLFYLLFVTMDEGGFLMTATDPEGEWKLKKLVRPYYDPGLFFDDDGKVYVVHEASKVFITEVNPDDFSPKTEPRVIFEGSIRRGLEGHHMYKINGYYYILSTYGGGDGFEACFRSKNIYGPYEEKVVLRDDMNLTGKGVHQGGIVETQTGEWWMIIFQDRDGVGRCPTLQPVEWIDGWPMIGKERRAVVTYRKPDVGADHPVIKLPTSDEFNKPALGMQWQWNHNPVDSKWSLTERKDWLRLHTVNVTDDIKFARNTLTQRIFGPYSTGTIEMDIRNMKNGDVAGLCLFQDPYAYVAVRMEEGIKNLIMCNGGKIIDSVPDFRGNKIWLRAHAVTITDKASFYYSKNNKSFKKIGNILNMKYRLTVFTGNKFCIFNYATKNTGGYVDINWFRMATKQGPPNLYKADEMTEAEMYDEIYKADTEICRDVEGLKDQDVTKTENGSWIRFDQLDFGKGVKSFYARAASESGNTAIELHLGSIDGPLLGTCKIAKTGGWQSYQTFSCPVSDIKGKQAIVFKFTGSEGTLVNLNWFSFSVIPYSLKHSTD